MKSTWEFCVWCTTVAAVVVLGWCTLLCACAQTGGVGEMRMTVYEDEIETSAHWEAVLHCAIENPSLTSDNPCTSIYWSRVQDGDEEGGENKDDDDKTSDSAQTTSLMVSDSNDTYRIVTELDHCASHLQILRDEELLKGLYSCTVACGSSTYTTTCPVTSFLHQNRSFLCAERIFTSFLGTTNNHNHPQYNLHLGLSTPNGLHNDSASPSSTSANGSGEQTPATTVNLSDDSVSSVLHNTVTGIGLPVQEISDTNAAKEQDKATSDEEGNYVENTKISIAVSFLASCVAIVTLVALTRWYVKRRMTWKHLALSGSRVRWTSSGGDDGGESGMLADDDGGGQDRGLLLTTTEDSTRGQQQQHPQQRRQRQRRRQRRRGGRRNCRRHPADHVNPNRQAGLTSQEGEDGDSQVSSAQTVTPRNVRHNQGLGRRLGGQPDDHACSTTDAISQQLTPAQVVHTHQGRVLQRRDPSRETAPRTVANIQHALSTSRYCFFPILPPQPLQRARGGGSGRERGRDMGRREVGERRDACSSGGGENTENFRNQQTLWQAGPTSTSDRASFGDIFHDTDYSVPPFQWSTCAGYVRLPSYEESEAHVRLLDSENIARADSSETCTATVSQCGSLVTTSESNQIPVSNSTAVGEPDCSNASVVAIGNSDHTIGESTTGRNCPEPDPTNRSSHCTHCCHGIIQEQPVSPHQGLQPPVSPNGGLQFPVSPHEDLQSPASPNGGLQSPTLPHGSLQSPVPPNGGLLSPISPNAGLQPTHFRHEELAEYLGIPPPPYRSPRSLRRLDSAGVDGHDHGDVEERTASSDVPQVSQHACGCAEACQCVDMPRPPSYNTVLAELGHTVVCRQVLTTSSSATTLENIDDVDDEYSDDDDDDDDDGDDCSDDVDDFYDEDEDGNDDDDYTDDDGSEDDDDDDDDQDTNDDDDNDNAEAEGGGGVSSDVRPISN